MNKKVSIIGILFLSIIALSTAVIFNSCKKDDSSTSCDRTCYFGTWSVSSQDCGGGYTVSIVASSTDGSSIDIVGFDGTGSAFSVTALVSGSSFSFSDQRLNAYDTYAGSGTLSSDEKTISISYTSKNDQGSLQKSCTETWTKQ